MSFRRPELWLSLGSLILALGVGEYGARKFLGQPIKIPPTAPEPGRPDNVRAMRSLHRADPLLGWTLNKGPMSFEHRLVSKEGKVLYDVHYGINEDGQRRTSDSPPDSAPLVVATGCSFTFGHAIVDDETWPWQLQERLPEYHVINVGTMGYGTDQALLAAERQVTDHPGHVAAVVLGLGDFQIERNRSPQGWLVFTWPFSKPYFRLTSSGGVEYKGQIRFVEPPLPSRLFLLGHIINTAEDRINRVVSHDQARQLTVGILREFAGRFQSHGVRFAVVFLPYAGDHVAEALGDHAALLAGLKAAGIPVLEPQFPRLPDGEFDIRTFMVTPADKHPNREYNHRLVSQLYPFLESNGIVSHQSAADWKPPAPGPF